MHFMLVILRVALENPRPALRYLMYGNGNHRHDGEATQRELRAGNSQATANSTSPAARTAQRRESLLMGSMVAATVCLIAAIGPGFANSTLSEYEVQRWVQPLPLPEPEALLAETDEPLLDEAEGLAAPLDSTWQTVQIKPGQTMGAVFGSLSLPNTLLHRLLERPALRGPLSRVRAGAQFEFDIPAEGTLRSLRFERDETSIMVVHIDGDTIREEIIQRDIQHRVSMASGVIKGSLLGATSKAGIGNGTAMEMAKVFGYDIDFTQDLRVGDRFSVVYEEVYRDGERLRTGNIIAASFINQGKPYHAFRYTFADGHSEYFDLEGRPLKKSFLRVPVEFARISSLFTSSRRHPVLGSMRAHKGVDYAAPTGTPIMAAGEGRASYVGWQNGYGNTVVIDHGRGYTTLYAHMSKFGKYKKGDRIRQGDVIGYVGSTGLSTGPHLHYEFRINGVHRDPLKVTLPKPEPLNKTEMARFRQQTQPLLAQLEMLDAQRHYAQN